MTETTLDLRGIPLWRLQEYLQDLGGQPRDDGWLAGPGWQARLTRLEDDSMGRMKICQVRLEWQADEAAQASTWPKLELKLIRPGG